MSVLDGWTKLVSYPSTLLVFGKEGECEKSLRAEGHEELAELLSEIQRRDRFTLIIGGIKRDGDFKSLVSVLAPNGEKWAADELTRRDYASSAGDLLEPVRGTFVGHLPGEGERELPTGAKPRVALLLLRVEPQSLETAASALEQAFSTVTVRDAKECMGQLEALPAEELALPLDEEEVRRWEERFVRGENLTTKVHRNLEKTAQALAGLKEAKASPALEIAVLHAQAERLLDAQWNRDASGQLERVVNLFASLVLVPALVSSVFGANVDGPVFESKLGWHVMIALMGIGAGLTYAGLSAIRISAKTRRMKLHVPGEPRAVDDQDLTWLTRSHIGLFAGGALGLVADALWYRSPSHLEQVAPSTHAGLWLGAAALLGVVLGVAIADWRDRSPGHAAIDVVFAGFCGFLLYAFLNLDWYVTPILLLPFAAFAAVFGFERMRRWLAAFIRHPDGNRR